MKPYKVLPGFIQIFDAIFVLFNNYFDMVSIGRFDIDYFPDSSRIDQDAPVKAIWNHRIQVA